MLYYFIDLYYFLQIISMYPKSGVSLCLLLSPYVMVLCSCAHAALPNSNSAITYRLEGVRPNPLEPPLRTPLTCRTTDHSTYRKPQMTDQSILTSATIRMQHRTTVFIFYSVSSRATLCLRRLCPLNICNNFCAIGPTVTILHGIVRSRKIPDFL